ncbi:MAG: UvrD-helicase domain-containing protein [Clostridia bacterium]|nr:UvrD-helicase domain-containing protein [Clostridia bacterium]
MSVENIDLLLKKLNDEQIKPVLDTEGAVLVIAGAGSGKTRVLTTRICYLIAEKKVSPSNILAITFTNKAAGEMKERLVRLVGNVSGMWVSTIHSMCVKILRSFIDRIGYSKDFNIYDETDKDKVLKRVIKELDFDVDKVLKTCKNYISIAKNECMTPEEFASENSDLYQIDVIYKVYSAYQSTLERSNCLDFDDLLFKTYELFVKNPDVADYFAEKFKYIHIDEFQDTNKVQFAICQRLSVKHGNIFVVGDDDQSIYGWRGAKIENILSFDDVYRGAKIYKLQRNYRSTKKILQLANGVICKNTKRRPKELWTDNPDGCRVETFIGTDENNEAAYVAMQIKSLMARSPESSYKDFAVFMRLNALSRAFEQEFTKYGIPYTIFGGFRFFERKEIKDVLSYLKLVANPSDDESFLRSVACPKRGIGDKTLQETLEFAVSRGESIFSAIDFLDLTTLSQASKTKLINFKNMIISFKEYLLAHSYVELIDYVLETTAFMKQFEEKTEEDLSRIYNISELKNSAEQFYKDNYGATLHDYLNSITLSSDTDSINEDNVVTIATIHSAKGLEYPTVFLAGCDEGVLPIARSVGDDDELEEERRLLYVAITRAKYRLYLTRATSRYMYGRREYMTQSRFLKDVQHILNPNYQPNAKPSQTPYGRSNFIEDDQGLSHNNVGGYSSSYAKSFLNNSSKPKPVYSKTVGNYKSGTKVKHVKFGEGTVILVKGEGDNIIVDVAFKGVGIKSLSVKYAPMEII